MAWGTELARLDGYRFEVRYSEGALVRARAVADIPAMSKATIANKAGLGRGGAPGGQPGNGLSGLSAPGGLDKATETAARMIATHLAARRAITTGAPRRAPRAVRLARS